MINIVVHLKKKRKKSRLSKHLHYAVTKVQIANLEKLKTSQLISETIKISYFNKIEARLK